MTAWVHITIIIQWIVRWIHLSIHIHDFIFYLKRIRERRDVQMCGLCHSNRLSEERAHIESEAIRCVTSARKTYRDYIEIYIISLHFLHVCRAKSDHFLFFCCCCCCCCCFSHCHGRSCFIVIIDVVVVVVVVAMSISLIIVFVSLF